MPPIVIAGGSGFLGLSLAHHLAASGVEVVILSRTAPRAMAGRHSPWRHVPWDGRTLGDWSKAIDGAQAIVNLAGRSVDCIKTPDHCDEILRSRIESTRVLGEAMRAVRSPPPVWVQMSTAHIYGDPPSVRCDEDAPIGTGLAPVVGQWWEEAFAAAALPTQRRVVLRTSFVIGRDRGAGGGALARLRTLARLGLGGRVGSGRQGMSWIHEADMNRIFERAIGDETMHGVYNASSPHPVPQQEFMRTLRRCMATPLTRLALPAPEWLVRLGASLILGTDPDLALYGRHILPRRLCEAGFKFRFPTLEPALTDLLGHASQAHIGPRMA